MAAPLPKMVDPRFADLWAKMKDPDPVVATVSAYRLSKIPDCAGFLQKQLQVISVSREEMEALLMRLNDGDEVTTEEVLQEMMLFDPRLTHTCAEQVKLMKNNEKLQKLLGIWTGYKFPVGSVIDRETIKIDPEPTSTVSGSLQFSIRHSVDGLSGIVTSVTPPEKIYNSILWQHRLALGILQATKTKESQRLLSAIATGHKRSAITVRAKQLLDPEKELPKAEAVLSALSGYETANWLNLMFALEADQQRLMEVVKLLPTLNLDEDKTEILLKELDSEVEATWKKALKELAYHQPLIHFDIPSISTKLTTGVGRGRYEHVHNGNLSTENVSRFDTIVVREDKMIAFMHGQNSTINVPATPETHLPNTWKVYLLLAPVLEQNKSNATKAVLAEWAGGHAKILPTRAAKESLKRLQER